MIRISVNANEKLYVDKNTIIYKCVFSMLATFIYKLSWQIYLIKMYIFLIGFRMSLLKGI